MKGSNPYSHFSDAVNNPCSQRLFEGIVFEEDVFDGGVEEEVWEAFPEGVEP